MTGSHCSRCLRDLLPSSSGHQQHLSHLHMHHRGSDDPQSSQQTWRPEGLPAAEAALLLRPCRGLQEVASKLQRR